MNREMRKIPPIAYLISIILTYELYIPCDTYTYILYTVEDVTIIAKCSLVSTPTP